MVTGIIVAAGSGKRLGAEVPKAFVEVSGASLLAHAAAALRAGGLSSLVAVVPDGWQERARAELGNDVVVVAGGPTRTASVAAGLAVLADEVAVVAVHDAARALVPSQVVAATVAVVAADRAGSDDHGAVIAAAPGLAVSDTLKRVERDSISTTVDRTDLVIIQTPQVFRRDVLEAAHAVVVRGAAGRPEATDDLALVERLVDQGLVEGRLVVTKGSVLAFKVTGPDDLAMAAAVFAARGVAGRLAAGSRKESS